ncbi:echotoxin-2-like [Poecilia latipinna]|nr:PREDICTED: echotoxin-2-like [Poecilia latipinna]
MWKEGVSGLNYVMSQEEGAYPGKQGGGKTTPPIQVSFPTSPILLLEYLHFVHRSHNCCSMTESAEAVAADVTSKRSVTIEISNITNNYCLISPKTYLDNGEVFNPPQPTVRPLKTEVCTFTKSGGKATGSVGVLTYDLFERSQNDYIETLAIMFSVPWDFNLYKNWFAVGIYKKGRNCDKDLFKEMYYEKKENEHGFVRGEANGSGINYVGNYLDIKATMCPLGNAIMKVEVWDKLFTHMGQQAY